LGAIMVATGALIITLWPTFPLVLAALVLQESTGRFLGIAIAAISLGLVGHAVLAERLGRNQRFASTGGVVAAGLLGLTAYFLSYRAIFFAVAALDSKEALSSLIVSALIMVPQVIVAIMAPWAGHRANTWSRRPLLLIGFAALPIRRALLFAWTTNPTILIAAQILDRVSGTVLGVLTALIVADLTMGTGRFNLAQGVVGTMSGVGASLSTTSQASRPEASAAQRDSLASQQLPWSLSSSWLRMPETNQSNRNEHQ
jgi:hypothetical protein